MLVKGTELGVGSRMDLNRMLLNTTKEYPEVPAISWYEKDEIKSYSYSEFLETAGKLSNAFKELGIEKGDRVAIYSNTRYEWAICDYAVLMAGGIVVTVHSLLNKNQVEYIIRDSGSKLVVVENKEMLENLENIDAEIVSIEKTGEKTIFDLIEKQSFEENQIVFSSPEDVASLVYTSGTTGEPKGAMLTHWNWVFNAMSVMSVTPFYPGEEYICYLPLSHVFQRIVFFAGVLKGANAVFTSPLRFVKTLREIRPVAFVAVPRILERMNKGIVEEVEKRGGLKKRIFYWARGVAIDCGKRMSAGLSFGPWLGFKRRVADALVFSKIRNELGLQRIRFICSSAAELHKDLAYMFNGMGIPVIEGYGMTETAGPSNLNPLGKFKPGTVGPPIPGTEEMIAPDGEILVRGDNVMKGYWNKPEKTAETIENGWLHSGDLGEFDDDGYLIFKGRKKHIIVLDTGKNVSPIPIEEELLRNSYISDAIIIGDGRPYVVALIQPNFNMLLDFAEREGIEYDREKTRRVKGISEEIEVVGVDEGLVHHPKVIEFYSDIVNSANQNLAIHEQVKKFRLISEAFSIEKGELTPTLKKRPHVILKNYGKLIEEMYS